MAKVQRITHFKITLEDKPGALLAIAKGLKGKNTSLVGLKALESQPGKSAAYLIPRNADKLRSTLKSLGLAFEEGTSLFVKGTDKTGALIKSLEAIAGAGVNIRATDAIAIGGNYGAFFRVASADLEKAAAALGAK